MTSIDTLKTRRTLKINNTNYDYYSLPAAESAQMTGISKLPCSLKILLENLLRHEDGSSVTIDDIKAINQWLINKSSDREVAYRPARVLMQDFTGVPAVVDLAAMRDAIQKMGGNPDRINPLSPVDLVIDHSVQVDSYGSKDSLKINDHFEMERNIERYEFLRWGQNAFQNFRVVPPDTGICHQVNLEYLAKTVWSQEINGTQIAYPDTLVGTDSHTTMINGLGVLGWGVGGIEAEAAMLGQPISMLIPEVIGVKLTGQLREGITATDLVLTITNQLRKKGVVGKFVEFYGPGLHYLPLADRATIANMAPEYGATCGFFPIDEATLAYLRLTDRDEQTVALVEAYAKAQGMWHTKDAEDPIFTDTIEVDLSTILPSLAGPKRPQDRVTLSEVMPAFNKLLSENITHSATSISTDSSSPNTQTSSKGSISHNADIASINASTSAHISSSKTNFLQHGDVVIAAITSCTNTSNPSVLMAAGLVAKKALEKGLKTQPWVKTSLAPGSQVVTYYLREAGLQTYLDELGFNLVGYGCTTCIGNSGPLPDPVTNAINENDLVVSAVLSGNRNFEGRVHPLVKANWLASPPLVVAYALAGTTQIDLSKDAIGNDTLGNPIYLKDIWPSNQEIANEVAKITNKMFQEQYADVFTGTTVWQNMQISDSETYVWKADSTYIQHPPFFTNMTKTPAAIHDIKNARILALLGDSITTDHISPAGSIKADSPAGKYLLSKGVSIKDFNSLGARRGNHEVMMRGTFANIRIKNEMVPGVEGGFTKYIPTGETLSIFDAAMQYQKDNTPLIIIAGKEYGTGSSRDWAAKGPKLLGISAVIAESFERIHRSNLIGMGILPLEFTNGMTRKTLQLKGDEIIDIVGLTDHIKPRSLLKAVIHRADLSTTEIDVKCRIDTSNEAEYYRNGGILQYVLRQMLS
ncbi:MAG: aconitate hydratase AcnA [Gammaproteobacteria bacterium]|nr:aconitate hydratase AcnA [Gammaproteobacteria bacterium]